MKPMFENRDIELRGARITVAPMQPEDRNAYNRLTLSFTYEKYKELTGEEPDSGFDDILAHRGEEFHALRLNDDGRFIGWIVLQKDVKGRPDIGIKLHEDYQKKGYGPEAIQLYCNWLYEKYQLEKIHVRIFRSNTPSQRAFAKVGAVKEETKAPDFEDLRDWLRAKGINVPDALMDRLLESDILPEQLLPEHYYIPLPINKAWQ